MPSRFKHYPGNPAHAQCLKGFAILCRAHDASSSFLDIFRNSRRLRRARGTPTDEEQDLLRAMLVFAASGLDSMVKQLVRDALPTVIRKDQGAMEVFKSYLERRLRKGEQLDSKFLAAVLVAVNPRTVLIRDLISDLTSQSLQSRDELFRVASYFNIPSHDLSTNPHLIDDIFRVRNRIAHEMDIDFNQPNRTRTSRRQADMGRYATEIFRLAEVFLSQVDSKL